MKKMMKNSKIKYRFLPLSQLNIAQQKYLDSKQEFNKFCLNLLFPQMDRYIIYPRVIFNKNNTIQISDYLFDPVAFGYLDEGRIYLKIGEFDRAISFFNKAITVSDTLYPAFSGLGHCYYFRGDYRTAIAYYNKALKINPNDYRFHYFKGKTFLQVNEYDSAITEFINSLTLCPRYKYTYEILNEWKEELNIDFYPELFKPEVIIQKGEGEIHIYLPEKNKALWKAYGMAKAIWLGEEEYRKRRLTKGYIKGWNPLEEAECLNILIQQYIFLRKKNLIERIDFMERLVKIAKDDYLAIFILYEILTRILPGNGLTGYPEIKNKMKDFIRKYVVVRSNYR